MAILLLKYSFKIPFPQLFATYKTVASLFDCLLGLFLAGNYLLRSQLIFRFDEVEHTVVHCSVTSPNKIVEKYITACKFESCGRSLRGTAQTFFARHFCDAIGAKASSPLNQPSCAANSYAIRRHIAPTGSHCYQEVQKYIGRINNRSFFR